MKSQSRLLLLPLLPLAAFVAGTSFAPPAQRIEGFDQPPPGTEPPPCHAPGEGCGRLSDPQDCMAHRSACQCLFGNCEPKQDPGDPKRLLDPDGFQCLHRVAMNCGRRWPCTSNQPQNNCLLNSHCVGSSQPQFIPGTTFAFTGNLCAPPTPDPQP